MRERQLAITAVLLVVALSVVLRLVPTLFVPSTNWADEIFQSVEPAHRLVYGYGLVPWEFRLGMRSWLLPGAVAGLIEVARLAGDGPGVYLFVITVGFGLLASAPVICCFFWAYRAYGFAAGLVAAIAVASAPELVYLGARTLSEVVAAHLLVVAWYLIEPGYGVRSSRRLFAAGSLLALVCLFRLQVAPAVGVLALWAAGADWRRRLLPLAAGGLTALAAGAALDWATLGYPFASLWRNVLYNGYIAVGSDISISPWYLYLAGELGVWGGAAPFFVILIALGARRQPALAVAAATVLAVHSLIPHKEYRFIYPAVALAMVLAALGLAHLIMLATEWLRERGGRQRVAAVVVGTVLLAGWCGLGLVVWQGGALAEMRQRDHDNLRAILFVRALPKLCGVGLYGGQAWDRFGGYTWLHRPVPMFWPSDETALGAEAPAFDTLLYRQAPPAALGFRTVQCFGQTCVAQRAGTCEGRPSDVMWYPPQVEAMLPPGDRFEAIPPERQAGDMVSRP